MIFEIYSSGAEEALLNAKYAVNIPKVPEIDTDFGQLLRKKKTQLKELLTMENLMGLMGQVGELYGERGSLNIPYNLRRLVKTYQGNFKHSNTRLKNLQANVNDILDGLRPSDTPPTSPPTFLTKVDCATVLNNKLNSNSSITGAVPSGEPVTPGPPEPPLSPRTDHASVCLHHHRRSADPGCMKYQLEQTTFVKIT